MQFAPIRFVKMHGAGNDFVLVDGRKEERDWRRLAHAILDRRFGVGGDQMLVVEDSERADLRMRTFNPDGSEAEISGNGIRCFVKHALEESLVPGKRTDLDVETRAGLHHLTAHVTDGKVDWVRVGMGLPRLAPEEILVAAKGVTTVVDHPLTVGGRTIHVTCVSMGNPHAVAFVKEPIDDWPLARLGPLVEKNPFFPERVNFEIVNVLSRDLFKVRVWERGTGETLACGTGASAIGVAARLKGLMDGRVSLDMPGGRLHVEWDGQGEVTLEGPAVLVFVGEWAGA